MNLQEWWCVIKIENEQRSALIGFHSSTGCDYTSSFFHKGKITSWKKHCKAKFLTALSILENQVTLDDETFSTLEEYTCCLYGSNSRNINKLRFQKFAQKYKHEENYFDLALLPPCRNPKSKLNCLLDETCKYCNSSRATPSIRWLGCN